MIRTVRYLANVRRLHAGQWRPTGAPMEITADGTALQVGIDKAIDLGLEGDNWEILVWAKPRANTRIYWDKPDALVRQRDLPTEAPAARTLRAAKALHRPRTRGPKSEVVSKVMPTEALLGRRILVSRNRRNQVGHAVPGLDVRAAFGPAPDAMPIIVFGVGELTVRGKTYTTLHTKVGEIRLTPGTGVIPA
jgi:hypothetical protein